MTDLNPLHFINVGPHGTFQASGKLSSSPQDVDAIIAHLEANNVRKLSIHFHGGLVSENAGAEVAGRLIPGYQSAGAHPVAFIWEVGLAETLKENLLSIHSTELAQLIIKFALQKLESTFGSLVGLKGSADQLSFEQIEQELEKEEPFADKDPQAEEAAADMDAFEIRSLERKFEAELTTNLAANSDLRRLLDEEAPETALLDPDFKAQVEDEEGKKGGVVEAYIAKKLAKILIETVKRFQNKSDHGLYPTLIEELLREMYIADLGAWVWGNMKRKAEEMWLPNQGPVTEFSKVGSYFLEKLSQMAAPPAIDLIGHSTGGIVICHVLKTIAARYPQLKARNLIFLAPACHSQLFYDEVVSRPERFENFRMFTMQDGFEKQDRLVPGVYTRSLLYLVSGILEDEVDLPVLGMVRYTSGEEPFTNETLLKIRDFLYEDGKKRLVLAKTSVNAETGLQSESLKHGNFDNDAATLASVFHLIQNG